jgi:V-type H+-transporting ATPase subunit a
MDNYGIASYQEVNPGLFAVVTFPFLFAVMFGDIGHGLMIFFAAIWMIWTEKSLAKQELSAVSWSYSHIISSVFPTDSLRFPPM